MKGWRPPASRGSRPDRAVLKPDAFLPRVESIGLIFIPGVLGLSPPVGAGSPSRAHQASRGRQGRTQTRPYVGDQKNGASPSPALKKTGGPRNEDPSKRRTTRSEQLRPSGPTVGLLASTFSNALVS